MSVRVSMGPRPTVSETEKFPTNPCIIASKVLMRTPRAPYLSYQTSNNLMK